MKKILLSAFAITAYLSVNAQCNELFFSEYVEGTGNDKALEIYNPTNAAINLTGYSVARYSNGATTSSAGGVTNLSGTIAAHDVFVLVNGQTAATSTSTSPAVSVVLQGLADQLDGAYPAPTYFNGDDAIALEKNGVQVDIFGKIGEDPGTAWTDVFPYTDAQGTWYTKDTTLVRKPTVHQGVTTNPSAFNVLAEWDVLPVNTWTGLGSHVCGCATTGISSIDRSSASVIVYPNPSNTDFFNVSTSEGIKTVELYNVLGEQITSIEGNKIGKHMRIETGNLAKGVYLVKVLFANDASKVVKISIQ